MNIENAKAQMRKGTLEFCILAIVNKKDCYASDIINTMKKKNLIVVEGTLYPLLTRHKNAGLLSYRWEESKQGPPRKYYALTEKGKTYMVELESSWKDLVESISSIISKK